FRFVGIEPLELADHLTVARRWGKDVKAFSSRRRFRPADGALRTTSGEGQAADGSKLSDHRYTGGRSRRVLDSPGAPERRHRKPRRRRGLDCNVAPAPKGKDRQDRWRNAGSSAARLQARRTSGLCNGQGAHSRRGRPPPPLPRAQGANRRESANVNRIKGFLFSQGVSGYQPLRRDRRQRLEELQTGDGRAFPQHLKALINR